MLFQHLYTLLLHHQLRVCSTNAWFSSIQVKYEPKYFVRILLFNKMTQPQCRKNVGVLYECVC